MADSDYVAGFFRDRASAERAFQSVRARGYNPDDVDLVMSEETRKRYFDQADQGDIEFGTKAKEGAGVGGAVGGTLGAIAGILATVGGSFVIPGLGLLVAGPLAGALAGAGAGAATGGLVGALVGMGIPEERIKGYEKELNEGGILMGVRPHTAEDAEFLRRQWTDPPAKDPMVQEFGIS